MFPLVAVWALRAGGLARLDWFVAIFVFTALVTLSAGVAQAVFAYLLAYPEVRRHRRWFVFYLVASMVFYTEFKNVINRVAQLKEFAHERQWKVTPRAAGLAEVATLGSRAS